MEPRAYESLRACRHSIQVLYKSVGRRKTLTFIQLHVKGFFILDINT